MGSTDACVASGGGTVLETTPRGFSKCYLCLSTVLEALELSLCLFSVHVLWMVGEWVARSDPDTSSSVPPVPFSRANQVGPVEAESAFAQPLIALTPAAEGSKGLALRTGEQR